MTSHISDTALARRVATQLEEDASSVCVCSYAHDGLNSARASLRPGTRSVARRNAEEARNRPPITGEGDTGDTDDPAELVELAGDGDWRRQAVRLTWPDRLATGI